VIVTPTKLAGVVTIDLTPAGDARGFFARAFSVSEMTAFGLATAIAQTGVSWNATAGTVRGMHYQEGADGEAKYVRCTAGRVHDVVVDLRPGSPTYRAWIATELSAANRRQLFIPPGCAHGFQTLDDDTEVFYLLSHEHRPARDRGARWDDPAFGIAWPLRCRVISPRDAAWPDHTG